MVGNNAGSAVDFSRVPVRGRIRNSPTSGACGRATAGARGYSAARYIQRRAGQVHLCTTQLAQPRRMTRATSRSEPDMWRFTPDGNDLEKIVVKGVIPDSTYLTFGYWLETTTDNPNSRTTYRAGVFDMGRQPDARVLPAILTPKAGRFQVVQPMRVLRLACSAIECMTRIMEAKWNRRVGLRPKRNSLWTSPTTKSEERSPISCTLAR